jgi:hypothetical protein
MTSSVASSCIRGRMFEVRDRKGQTIALQRSKIGGDALDLPVPIADRIELIITP